MTDEIKNRLKVGLAGLLIELEKMTVAELEEFRIEWLESLRENNASKETLYFSGLVVDVVRERR